LHAPHARRNGHGASGAGVDTQLETLMDKYVEAVRLQNSLKKQIKQTLREREAEVKRKEEEAKEALRRAKKEKDALKKASALMKERMKDAEIMESDDGNEDGDKAGSVEDDDEWEDYVDGGQNDDCNAQMGGSPISSPMIKPGRRNGGLVAPSQTKEDSPIEADDEERVKSLANAIRRKQLDKFRREMDEREAQKMVICMNQAKAQLQAEKEAREKRIKEEDTPDE
jgi:hypothetical protein